MNVFILAGGHGSRLHPYTQIIPKPLIPICGKAFLWYIVERFISEKYSTITFLVAEEDLANFKHEFRDCINASFVPSGRQGTAGAFCEIRNLITEPFLIVYGDLLVLDINYADFYREATKILPRGGAVLLGSTYTKVPYGIITLKAEDVTFQEKPELALNQWTGIALIHNEALQHVYPMADWGRHIFPKIPLKTILTNSQILHITSFNDIEPISERLR